MAQPLARHEKENPSGPVAFGDSRASTSRDATVSEQDEVQNVAAGQLRAIIERIPPPVEEDKSHPLPSRWSEDDRMAGLEILGDGNEIRFNGVSKGEHEAASVRADHPMPKEVGMYYYEVTVLSRGKEGLIGTQTGNICWLAGRALQIDGQAL